MNLHDRLADCRVLPVVTPRDVDSTLALAAALERGGMRAVEITLRSPAALDSVRAVKAALPQMTVAVGTVLGPGDVEAALAAGADLVVSPGISEGLLSACEQSGANCLPGVATASEVMLGLGRGLTLFKLFPARAAGGIALLQSLAGPFPQVSFCPTGGLDAGNFRDYLALPNVVCCGGSWMVTGQLVQEARFDEIEELARQALA